MRQLRPWVLVVWLAFGGTCTAGAVVWALNDLARAQTLYSWGALVLVGPIVLWLLALFALVPVAELGRRAGMRGPGVFRLALAAPVVFATLAALQGAEHHWSMWRARAALRGRVLQRRPSGPRAVALVVSPQAPDMLTTATRPKKLTVPPTDLGHRISTCLQGDAR